MVERLNQVALAEEREIYKEKERIANILFTHAGYLS
jgi:hypothetical protein